MPPPPDHSNPSLLAPVDDTLIGRVISGKFALRRCVGIGSSGSVYLADQTTLGRTVAVKVLRPEMASDPRFIRRFNDEALAASRLNHPNVVSIIDYGQTDDGLFYLVMEFLRGSTLTHVLRTEALGVNRIVGIMTQILSALEEAHESGVVHADLKADNILVEHRRGGWDLVKVVDFGIARLVGQQEDRQAERTICGTPEYMAPEVIKGQDPTFASDIYSVGVILYELMTGVTPFVGGETMEVLRRHLGEAPEPPRKRRSDLQIHPLLEDAALRALAKESGDRFATATEFREFIEGAGVRSADIGEEEVLCIGCGNLGARSFKFCPECGQPRAGEAVAGAGFAVPEDFWGDETPTADFDNQVVSESVREAKPVSDAASGILPLPLIGREEVLAELRRYLCTPSEEVLHLCGPGGSGCTSLIGQAAQVAASAGTVIYLAGADPSGLAAPFFPIRSIVAAVLQLPRLCGLEDLAEALEALGLSKRDLPGIAELFGHEGELWQLEPSVRRRELLAATIRVLRSAARKRDSVFVFDDFDQYDNSSVDLLRWLVEANDRGSSVRVLLASSDSVRLDWPALRRVEVRPLGDDVLRAIAAHCATRGHPDLVTVDELRATGGLASHIQGLVRFVIEGGVLERAPESLADLVAARLDLLPALPRRVLLAAAVFGTEAGIDELSRALEGVVPAEFQDALELLEARGFVVVEGERLLFPSPFTREVVYESIPANTRRELHAAAAEILIDSVADPAVLGHHAQLSGDHHRSAELLARAGDNAVYLLDDAGACALYNRALVSARARLMADDSARARSRYVTTAIKLADALRAGGEPGLSRGILDEAKPYCSGAPALEAQLLRASAQLLATEGRLDLAVERYREAIGLAIPEGQADFLAELYLDLATMFLRTGRSDDAIRELSEGIDLVTLGEGPEAARGPRFLWRLLLRLAQLMSSSGQAAEAIGVAEHAVRHANSAGSRVGVARTQAMLAGQYDQLGDRKKAEILRRRAVDEMRALGDRRGTAELLLAGVRPTAELGRITPASVREARLLAEEVGWAEGVRRARRASDPPR